MAVFLKLRAKLFSHRMIGTCLALCFTLATVPVFAGEEFTLHWSERPPLPNSPGLASPFAGFTGEVLIVAGGANFPESPPWKGGRKVWHDAVYALIDNEWKIIGKLPCPCAYGVSFSTDDGIICAGGSDSSRHFDDVFRIRLQAGEISFETLPSLPRPIANACGARVGSVLYLAGGTESPDSNSALATVYAMDLSDSRPAWSELPEIPGPGRILSVAATHGDSFFVFSGAELVRGLPGKPVRKYLTDAFRFEPASRRWIQLQDMPRPAVAAPSPAPVTASGKILIPGGDDGSKVGFEPPEDHPGFAQVSLVYDVRSDSWSNGPGLSVSRVTAPLVSWQRRMVLISGEARPGVRSPQIWNLKVESDSR